MAKLVPVNYDPFAKPKGGARLVAVDYDPFAKPKLSEDLKRRQAEIEAEIKRRQAQIEQDKRKAEAERAAPKSFFELLTRGVTGGETEEAGVRDDAKAFEARAAANRQAIDALNRERQFIQEQGRPVPKLTTIGRIREAAKALPAQAIRSTSQFAGSAGVIPGVGEDFARRMEQRGENVVKSLGLQESEEVQFDPLQQAISGVTGGIGSLLPYVGTELAGRGLGRGLRAVEAARAADIALKTSRGAQAALGAGQGAAQQRQQIEEFERETGQTVSPFRRSASQFGGLVIGLSEALPIPGMAQTGVARIAAEGLKNRIVKSAIEEGAQEGGAQLAQNVIEATGYNPEKVRNLGEDVLENAALGAITGGIVSGTTGGAQAIFERGKPAPAGNVPPPPPGAEAKPLRTTTVTYPNREDPTNPVTRTLDVLSEPDTDGYITVRDDTGKAFEMKAADLEELEIASPAYKVTPETEAPPPTPTVDRATITERLRLASGTPEGKKPVGRVISLANDVASALEAEDPVAAQRAIQSRMNALAASRMAEETKAQRQAEIDEAQSIVNDYRVEFARARAAAPARVEAPAIEPSSVEQALEQNAALAAEDEVRASEERAALERESALESASLVGQGSPIRQAQTERQQLFDSIINDDTVENPAGAFRQALAERGYPKTELNEAERRQVQARLAFEQAPIVEEEPVAGEPTEVPAPPSAAPPEVVAGAAEPVVEEPGVPAVALGEEPTPSAMAGELAGAPVTAQEAADYDARKALREDARNRLREVLKGFGFDNITVIVRDLLEGGKLAGSYDPMDSIIRVAMNPDGTVMESVLYHELVHYLKDHGFFSDAEWNAILKFAKRDLVMRGIIEYAYRGETRANKDEEIVAEAFRAWMAEGAEGFQKKNNVFAKIRRFLNAIRDFFFSQNLNDANAVFDAIRNGEFATREDKGSAKRAAYFTGTAEMPGRRPIYAGSSITRPRVLGGAEEAKLIRADYDAAQRMEEAGESPETIRVATGWERNPYDNEWRYLQPDDLAYETQLLEQLIADFDVAKDFNEMAFDTDGAVELQDIMGHPELYQIYPSARFIKVFVKKSKPTSGLQGSFNPENKTITLYTGAKDPLGTLLHEVQHWVQDKEGFPTGSSPETVWDKLSDEQKIDEAALVVAGKRIEAQTYRDAAGVISWLRKNIRKNLGKNPTPDQIESLLDPYGQENPAISGEAIDAAIGAIIDYNAQREAFGADPVVIGASILSSIESELESEANDQEAMAETVLDGGVTIEGSPAEKIVRDDFEGNILMSRSELRYQDTAGEIEARDVSAQRVKNRDELRAAGALASERPRKPKDVVISRRSEGPAASVAQNPTVPPSTTKGAKLGFITNMRNFMSDLYRKHMYKYSGALKLDEKLANALGVKKLPKEMSLEDRASMFETMRSGLLRDFKRMWFDPFKRAIKASGIDPQDLSMYLWARSAADRNALIAERNRDMPDGGSGLTNLEAEAILAYYKASGLMRKMEPLIKQHDQLVDWMLKQRVKNGLMSKAEADLLRKQQPFYTPLKGFAADGDMFTAGDEDPHTDYKGPSQLGVRPQDYIKTEGRASMPFDPVSNLISDAMYLTQRIARNDVGKRFVSIVRDFPDLLGDAVKIYTDDKPKIVSKGIAPPGSTKKTVGPMNMAANANKFIVVKIDGKNYYVELNEKKSDGAMLKRMFENMTPKDLDGLVKVLAKLGNLKKQMLTRFNPPFWVWNFGTDVYDAIVTAISEKTREGSPVQGKDVALRFMGNLVKPSTWTAVGRYITGRDPTDAKAAENVLLLSQMVQDGGEAGRQYVMKAEEVADEIKRDAAIIKSGGVKNIWGKANEKRRALVRVVDGINEFLGLVPRFAAYKAAIDAGVEADDAAKFALDSTLNLSRKGEATDAVDNIYLFTNPAAQSLEKKGRIYKSKYGRRALASMMTLGVGLHFFNMMMAGDEDDDGENDYQELDEATKLKNLIIYTGDGEPIKMPVGFLVAFEVYLGQQLARMITNDSSGIGVMQAAANAWNGFFSSQLPAGDKIGNFGDIFKIAIPDVFTFGVDLYRNKNYFDGQIYPEPYYEGQAVSGMPRESTGEFYKKFAAAVNRWGGGTEDVASDFDTPAEAWQYAVNQNLLVGGAGIPRDFFKAYEEADVTKLPIVKRFVGDNSEYAAQNKYFDRIQKIEVIAGQKEGENKNSDAYAESKEKFPVEADSKVIKAYKDSEKQLRKLNKDAREARKNGGPNMQSKLDKIKQDRNEVYVKFNRKYNEVKQGL